MKHGASEPEGIAVRGLRGITQQELKLRRGKIALLRQELAKHREVVRRIEHELRALGDPEATRIAGKVDWDVLYYQLPVKFSARDVAARAGVAAAHVASATHRWRRLGLIVSTSRGQYRKAARRDAGMRK
jgi:CRP-like cAMP-binding protein